jgi:hypothetical protein
MPRATKIPDSCAGLDFQEVQRTLAKHTGDIYKAAKEIGVSGPDLRRLTWARPDLLQDAVAEAELTVAMAEGVLIEMLYSDDPRRRERAADKILSSWIARDHPLSPARR